MPLLALDALPAAGRVLGIDLGTKTIGLAVSDPGRMVASPVGTIRRTRWTEDSTALLAAIDERGVAVIVLGLPINMDGSEGPRAQATRAFARNLLALRDFPLALWDERLSTAAVERAMIEADLSRRRRAESVDAAAAAYLLQGALDFLARRRA
ncbi:MAG: Holliday junction resolvase RuvX [Alphaproteobacteria bacterium]|nr:Holliday junction resolvase RuvX [Alphaproteobacteria bacterium]